MTDKNVIYVTGEKADDLQDETGNRRFWPLATMGSEAFVVLATIDHECSDAVRSFADKLSAEVFAQSCREHESKRCSAPDIHSADSEWDKWNVAQATWELSHPAAPYTQRDYSVCPVPFIGAAPVAETLGNDASNWKPVAEQLPTRGESVLVAAQFVHPDDWRVKVGGLSDAGTWKVFGASWTPSHWMPLPSPPQVIQQTVALTNTPAGDCE